MKSQPCACLVFAVLSAAPLSAGDFVNLGFESPDLSHAIPTGHIPEQLVAPTSETLRGWSLTADVVHPTSIYITPAGNLQPPVALTGTPSFPGTGLDFGKYQLFLANPSMAPDSLRPIYHLSQMGTIPVGAMQLIYYHAGSGVGSPETDPNRLQILVNGTAVPYTEGRLTSIGRADVSAYAGQEVSLEFVFPKGSFTLFDIAGFSIVPEPSTYALLGLGAAALGWHCRRRSHS